MFPIENSREVLEKGRMVNPDTGIVEEYQELWEDLEIKKIAGGREYVSWVLKLGGGDRDPLVRGIVVRVGQWIQGVLRDGKKGGSSSFSVARWKFDEELGWVHVLDVGRLQLDREVFTAKEIRVGDIFDAKNGWKWVCVESHRWT